MAGLMTSVSEKKKFKAPPTPAVTSPAVAAPAAAQAVKGVAAGNGFVPKTTDVAKLTADITGTDSQIMRQARTQGLKAANRQGLLSSSMAVSAAEDSAYAAATPMAQATAGYNSAENLKHLDIDAAAGLQANEIASNEKMQLRDIESKEGLAAAQRGLDLRMQRLSLNSSERQQLRDLASREGMAAADRQLSKYQSDRSLNTQSKLQQQQLVADNRNKRQDRQLQTQLAKWNLDANDREKATAAISAYNGTYESALDAINKNTDLSAEQRTKQIKSLNARRTAYYNTMREMYDVDIAFPNTTPSGNVPKKVDGLKPAEKPAAAKKHPTSLGL